MKVKLTSYDRLALKFIAPSTNRRTWLARETSMLEAYHLMWQAKSRKYRGMFDEQSPKNHDKFGKGVSLNN